MDWQTFGHQAVKFILNKQIEAQKFPHAYLFAGPKGVGKKTLALEFTKKVLGAENLSNHPDFAVLDESGEIIMETMLDFISRLSYKPFLAQKKIAVINNAQNLNQQSGNALLKTLEEASPSTIIILLADSLRLLPTIVSRCQVLNFHPFSKKQLADFAEKNNLQITEPIIDLSFGSPARLKELSQDKEFLKDEEAAVESYKNFGKMRLGEKLMSISGLAELEAEDLFKNLQTWLMWQNGRLAANPADYVKARALGDSLKGLKQNKNKKLVLQGLLLRI
jgi:DNA polymerase III subunit delta'